MYKSIIRPLLFKSTPEKAHKIVSFLIALPFSKAFLKLIYNYSHDFLATDFVGLNFKNPVGLAAGFDKEASMIPEMASIGFGFIEIGTITPLTQDGNPKPRLFRLPKDEALINRMGFNNQGLEAAISRLRKKRPKNIIIGGNIGKNKITPLESAVEDYKKCFLGLHPYVDYFVVNVSSPNTPNLRQLQDKKPLTEILKTLQSLNGQIQEQRPIFLKIAPDLNEDQLDDIIEIVTQSKIAGIVATNTTIERKGLSYDAKYIENIGAGGLSGRPLRDRATEVIKYIHRKSSGKIPMMAAGGIHSPEDALEKIQAGASLVQIYTGFIYEGPGLIKNINKKILAHRKEN